MQNTSSKLSKRSAISRVTDIRGGGGGVKGAAPLVLSSSFLDLGFTSKVTTSPNTSASIAALFHRENGFDARISTSIMCLRLRFSMFVSSRVLRSLCLYLRACGSVFV